MTADEFRGLALELPEAVESDHMGHPDFRVRGKIFATIAKPDEGVGMVKLTPEQQAQWVEAEPEVFFPVPGGWGRRGATYVHLAPATAAVVRPALVAAWRNVAPKRVAREYEPEE